MTSGYLYAEGVSPWWYALLWLELVPFGLMVLRVLRPRGVGKDLGESVALNGAVLAAVAAMILTSLWAAVLFARAVPPPRALRWALALGAHFTVWAFLGSAMLFAAFQALGAGSPIRTRRFAALGALAGALLIHAVTLYITWRAWPR